MAKKNDKKKDKKATAAKKPVVKKASKPAPKKVNKPAKKAAPKPAKKAAKPAAKKAAPKPVKKAAAKPAKKVAKPAPKKAVPAVAKKAAKPAKEIKKTSGKPIDAIAKNNKPKKGDKVKGGKKKGGGEDDDEEDVDVKDDYEKADEDDVLEGDLDEAGIVDLDGGGTPEPDDDDDEVPEKRGRGRRKKNEGKSGGNSMEAYIRNRPLQIDISKPLIKKSNEGTPKPFVNTKDNRSRYTDKELAEFKELILEKLKEAQADYDLLKQTLSNEDNHGTDDTSPTFKLLEDGSDVMSKEETAQLAARQEKYIINLKNALVRIENKTYGICRVTGKLIPKERLRSVPHATLGIDAKLNQNV
ncbi:MAG: putative regulatory protein [Bacteroidetes bacterium]|jgi:RNA polymerase-binding transcription factor DksA|nr:putative regulatory protein [Bacteroidota bacterium]